MDSGKQGLQGSCDLNYQDIPRATKRQDIGDPEPELEPRADKSQAGSTADDVPSCLLAMSPWAAGKTRLESRQAH